MNRDLMKTLSYGLMHFSVAISVAYALTQSWKIALSVGVIEPFVQTIAYTLHERVWNKIQTPTPFSSKNALTESSSLA